METVIQFPFLIFTRIPPRIGESQLPKTPAGHVKTANDFTELVENAAVGTVRSR
jgi:hypothetical protein